MGIALIGSAPLGASLRKSSSMAPFKSNVCAAMIPFSHHRIKR